MARICVDAMGGDFAPQAPVAGALLALAELPAPLELQLVGASAVIESQLAELLAGELASLVDVRDRLIIVEAPDVIAMTDKPAVALRSRPNSSMVVGIKRVADGLADAFISAGNTGAQMAASTFHLKLNEGLTRPAIGTIFPTANQPVLVLDSGANVDCSALELVQFARIGATYAQDLLGRTSPAIGLLSIGEEAEKGNAVVKEAHQLLLQSGLNFIGNVEGRDLATGVCDRGPIDVVVCDGFVGNVVLKFYEALAPTLIGMVADQAQLDRGMLRRALHQLDADEYGGAPLLGVNGVSIISHGKSSPTAIKNAIRVAQRAYDSDMTAHIRRRLAESVPAPEAPTGSAA